MQPPIRQHRPRGDRVEERPPFWWLRPFWPPDPITGVLLLAATFDWLSGNPVHALFLGIIGLALGRERWRNRRARGAASSVILPADEEDGRGLSSTSSGTVRVAGSGAVLLGESGEDSHAVPAAGAGYRAAFFAVGGIVYALVVGSFARYSWPATIAVASLGAAVVAWGWEAPADEAPSSPPKLPRRGALAWAAVFVAGGLWELTALLMQPTLTTDSYTHPTISVLSDPVLATHGGRAIVLLVWLAGGWYLIRRGTR